MAILVKSLTFAHRSVHFNVIIIGCLAGELSLLSVYAVWLSIFGSDIVILFGRSRRRQRNRHWRVEGLDGSINAKQGLLSQTTKKRRRNDSVRSRGKRGLLASLSGYGFGVTPMFELINKLINGLSSI